MAVVDVHVDVEWWMWKGGCGRVDVGEWEDKILGIGWLFAGTCFAG